jgi:D-alanyl-lipoteichoic acid acyltransferase DltB (MBOAT superfamily)
MRSLFRFSRSSSQADRTKQEPHAQFSEEHQFSGQDAADGIRLMALGFFKKLVVADYLSTFVNSVYNDLPDHSGLSLIVATVLFAFQIYCDFPVIRYLPSARRASSASG